MGYNDYHIHTKFCDGANTVSEMVESAIEKGCEELGFSGHAYMSFDESWTMSIADIKQYKADILEAKEKYKDRIKLFTGIEEDYYACTPDLSKYDYVIGSVHCLFRHGIYVSVDSSVSTVKKGIDHAYGGDVYAYIEHYYDKVSKLYDKTGCNIIGHFDLVTKFQEQERLFDLADPRYIKAVNGALDKLTKQPVVFEINTGAISRGFRASPYPDTHILEYLSERGAKVILSSDAHTAKDITYGFLSAENLVKRYNLKLVRSISELL